MTIDVPADLAAKGYRFWGDADPFEELAGPFFFASNEDGTYKAAFHAEDRHCNGSGPLHGGLLMTFADYALFAIARDELQGRCVTIAFNSEFVSAGFSGELIEAKGEIVRATKSLLFVRGEVFTSDRTIMTFSGILKRTKS